MVLSAAGLDADCRDVYIHALVLCIYSDCADTIYLTITKNRESMEYDKFLTAMHSVFTLMYIQGQKDHDKYWLKSIEEGKAKELRDKFSELLIKAKKEGLK